MTTLPHLLSPAEVAAYLGVPISWVRDHSNGKRSPQLPCFKLGKYWRYRQDELERWLKRGEKDAA